MSDSSMSHRTSGRMRGAAAVALHLPDLPRSLMPTPHAADDLFYRPAVELAARIRRKQVSAREVMKAHLDRIASVNEKVNAIVTLVADRAMDGAARADE